MKRVCRFMVIATFSLAMVFASESNAARKNGNKSLKDKGSKTVQVRKGNRSISNRDAHVIVKNHAPKEETHQDKTC